MRALHDRIEGDVVIPRISPNSVPVGRPLSAAQVASLRVRGGWNGRAITAPLGQSFWLLVETHSDSLCHGVTVNYQIVALTQRGSETPIHPRAHVQYRGPLGGSALRGRQVAKLTTTFLSSLPPSPVCVLWSHCLSSPFQIGA